MKQPRPTSGKASLQSILLIAGIAALLVLDSRHLSPLNGARWTAWAFYALTALLLLGGLAVFVRRRAREIEAERRRGEFRVERARTHDPLTGLANKSLFTERLESALSDEGESGPAVIFVDINRFRRINESFGHRIGDQVLHQFAERVRAQLLPGDTIARFGGDHFAVLRSRTAGESDALDLVNRIQRAAETPFDLDDSRIKLRVTVGIALEGAGADADVLMRRADTALAEAKQRGVEVEIFGESLEGRAQRRFELEATLRDAIREDQLVLHYQPVVSLRSGQVTGFEALVRWEHPVRGLLPPADFIPLAEETGAIVELGDWVLRNACEQAAAWQQSGHRLKVAVNLSARELSDPTLTGRVRQALRTTGLEPGVLILEITETALASGRGATWMLAELRKLGVQTAIDDFGVGYSSWSRLARMPIDMLKIDRSFVSGMEDERTGAVLATKVRLGGSLGLAVVAEGVETADEARRLAEMGCQLQGFYFSKPVSPEVAQGHLDDEFSLEATAAAG
jgi:diguanylate cyclase (GGDEF)-like protein